MSERSSQYLDLLPFPVIAKRNYNLLLFNSGKVFIGAALWELFSYICVDDINQCSTSSTNFYFMTGFGEFLGIFIGEFVLVGLLQPMYAPYIIDKTQLQLLMNGLNKGLFSGLIIFFGIGTMWQYNVNISHKLNCNFTQAFFYMFFISLTVNLVSISFWRYLHTKITNDYFHLKSSLIDPIENSYWYDFQVSISVAMASSFFMGTSATEYVDNWLAPLFGVYSSTPLIEAVLLAGCSSWMGFILCQIIQNCFVVDSWIDKQMTSNYNNNEFLYEPIT
eukprot:gene5871-8096_t